VVLLSALGAHRMVAVNIELERNEHKGLGKRLQPQDSLFKWINMVFILSKIIILIFSKMIQFLFP